MRSGRRKTGFFCSGLSNLRKCSKIEHFCVFEGKIKSFTIFERSIQKWYTENENYFERGPVLPGLPVKFYRFQQACLLQREGGEHQKEGIAVGAADLLRELKVLQEKIDSLRYLESGVVSREAEAVSRKLALLIENLEAFFRQRRAGWYIYSRL